MSFTFAGGLARGVFETDLVELITPPFPQPFDIRVFRAEAALLGVSFTFDKTLFFIFLAIRFADHINLGRPNRQMHVRQNAKADGNVFVAVVLADDYETGLDAGTRWRAAWSCRAAVLPANLLLPCYPFLFIFIYRFSGVNAALEDYWGQFSDSEML